MNYINVTSFEALAAHGIKKAAVAIGVFDGVHRGHQKLIGELVEIAAATGAQPVAMTFFPHPRAVINPGLAPVLLAPPYKKIELLHRYGVNAVVTLPFTRDFAALDPEDFIADCLITSSVELAGLCVGEQWRFGKGGSGNVDTLHNFADRHGFVFKAVAELKIADNVVSSTAIRQAIASGRLLQAQEMLGRRYSLCGIVESGHHVAARELSHPTANLHVEFGILPPDGVYAARAVLEDGSTSAAAVNVGVSPTYNRPEDKCRRLEAHLLNFDGNLYRQKIEIELVAYLREERCFSNPQQLRTQIEKDIEAIELLLRNPENK